MPCRGPPSASHARRKRPPDTCIHEQSRKKRSARGVFFACLTSCNLDPLNFTQKTVPGAQLVAIIVYKVEDPSVARIYTRAGDDGTTGLIGGKRVSKDTPRIEACGSVDELNAIIGAVRSYALPESVDKALQRVQENLFLIGASLATPEGADRSSWEIRDADVSALEKEIDAYEDSLEPLAQFILPGGAAAGASLHLARTISRRAERRCVALSRIEKIDLQIICYLNRLSDFCFVLARYVNRQQSIPESHPSFEKRHLD